MSKASCRKILTDFGFKDNDADAIINNLSNVESVSKYAKEIKTRLSSSERIKASQKISERRTKETIDSLHESVKIMINPLSHYGTYLLVKADYG